MLPEDEEARQTAADAQQFADRELVQSVMRRHEQHPEIDARNGVLAKTDSIVRTVLRVVILAAVLAAVVLLALGQDKAAAVVGVGLVVVFLIWLGPVYPTWR